MSEGNRADNFIVTGYNVAQTLVQVLKQCRDDLTRENIMNQAANLKDFRTDNLLPGITINTSATNFYPIQAVQLARLDGQVFKRFREVFSNQSQSQ